MCVILHHVEGIDAAGDARADATRIVHRRVVHRRLDTRLVKDLAVARQGGDEVGADLVEQARGHGCLADDVQPFPLGEVQQANQKSVRPLRAEILSILLLHLEPQRPHVVLANADLRDQPCPSVVVFDARFTDTHRSHRPRLFLVLCDHKKHAFFHALIPRP